MKGGSDPRLRITLRQLEVFVATARTGSTRAAADVIARSQSASSAALGLLEGAFGRPLFDRVGRRLLLNDHGRTLLPMITALLSQASDLQTQMATPLVLPLRIASSFTVGEYLLPEVIGRWKHEHPDITAKLVIGNTSDVISSVAAMEVDIGFIEGLQRHPDVVVNRWVSDELVVFAAPSHPLSGRKVAFGELASAPWVLRERGSGTRDASDRLLLDRIADLRIAVELGSTEAVKRVVAAGVGIGCLSRHAVAEAFASGWLVELRTPLPKSQRALSIVVARDRAPGRIAQTFLRACQAYARAPSPTSKGPPTEIRSRE